MHDFSYIQDTALRINFENAFKYVMHLVEHIPNDVFLREEYYRTIVVYIVSIIEAFLAYFYILHKTKESYIGKEEYRHVVNLPNKLSYNADSGLVLAKKAKRELDPHEISVPQYVDFFVRRGDMKETTGKRIMELSKMRNTVHLGAARLQTCDNVYLNEAMELLKITLTKGRDRLAV